MTDRGDLSPEEQAAQEGVGSGDEGYNGPDYNATDDAAGRRLYNLLAYFDTRDGTPMADLVRSAREGWERSGSEMDEPTAWDEFDARWAKRP